MKPIIAIDGPAASGKSTVSKLIAEKLNFDYLDTGAMYRAYTLFCLRKGFDLHDESLINKYLSEIKISFKNKHIFMNGEDITTLIRGQDVTANVSLVCAYFKVREFMVDEQRRLSLECENGCVLDGRDIGTVVFPNATLKIYLTASYDVRALRRKKDNDKLGIEMSIEDLKQDLIRRDTLDSTREHSPLKQASDAILLDNSNITLEETCNTIIAYLEEKLHA